MDSLDRLADLLLSKLNIFVSGATGPKRDEPLQCFWPVHHSYSRLAASANHHPLAANLDQLIGGGSLRTAAVRPADNDSASLVYDRDIVTTWRLPNSMAAYEIYF